MTFFPVLRVPGFEGTVTVHNFSPNNFEENTTSQRHIYVCWTDGNRWRYKYLASLKHGESKTVRDSEMQAFIPQEFSPFVFMTHSILTSAIFDPTTVKSPKSQIPSWRGTIAIESANQARSSYQGEIHPLPSSGTCLTFNHLQQPGEHIRTWLIAVNLEASAIPRKADIDFYNSAENNQLLHRETMVSNGSNSFLLPKAIASNQNIAILCRTASFIPVFLSHDIECRRMSLEHTHPPASSAIYGDRFRAQKIIKSRWLSELPSPSKY